MAAELWMSKQDRAGISIGPNLAVPASKATYDVTLDTKHPTLLTEQYLNESQTMQMTVERSLDGVNFQTDVQATFLGGVLPNGPGGVPGIRGFSGQPLQDPYPTHLRCTLEIAGVVNCGVNVEFHEAQ